MERKRYERIMVSSQENITGTNNVFFQIIQTYKVLFLEIDLFYVVYSHFTSYLTNL